MPVPLLDSGGEFRAIAIPCRSGSGALLRIRSPAGPDSLRDPLRFLPRKRWVAPVGSRPPHDVSIYREWCCGVFDRKAHGGGASDSGHRSWAQSRRFLWSRPRGCDFQDNGRGGIDDRPRHRNPRPEQLVWQSSIGPCIPGTAHVFICAGRWAAIGPGQRSGQCLPVAP